MQKRTKESKKRLNSLILLIAFTAILLIISTYAWFTTQKNVRVYGLKGKVSVAEGMEISLDAANWSTEINLEEANLTGNTLSVDPDGTPDSGDEITYTYAAYAGNKNVEPNESVGYIPVSTSGEKFSEVTSANLPAEATVYADSTESASNDFILFSNGTFNGSKTLNSATTYITESVDPDNKPHESNGYYAFDLFVKNSSSATGNHTLQITDESSVIDKYTIDITDDPTGTFTDYGTKNTMRVAFARVGNSVEINSTTDQILSGTNGAISGLAIWEPNSNAHVQEIIDTLKPNGVSKFTLPADATTLGFDDAAGTWGATSQIKTYAVKASSFTKEEGKIEDVYKWNGTEGKLDLQKTLQSPATGMTIQNLKDVYIAAVEGTPAADDFTIGANKITRLRIYVWMEGQDVDTLNWASYGQDINVDIGFARDLTVGDKVLQDS